MLYGTRKEFKRTSEGGRLAERDQATNELKGERLE